MPGRGRSGCGHRRRRSHGRKLPEKATAKLESSAGTITCNEASFLGEFNSNGTSPKGGGIKQWKFGNSKSTKCPSTLPLKPNVEIKMEGLPYDASKIEYKSTKAPQGSLMIAGTKGVTMKLGFGTECTYESSGGTMTSSFINPKEKGKLAEIELAGPELKKVGGGESCPGWFRFLWIWWTCEQRWSDVFQTYILVPVVLSWG